MSDEVLFVAMIVAFASGVTAHVAIAAGLLARAPRWRAAAALALPPLAPYWALRERMRVRAGAWIASVAVYVVMRLLARA